MMNFQHENHLLAKHMVEVDSTYTKSVVWFSEFLFFWTCEISTVLVSQGMNCAEFYERTWGENQWHFYKNFPTYPLKHAPDPPAPCYDGIPWKLGVWGLFFQSPYRMALTGVLSPPINFTILMTARGLSCRVMVFVWLRMDKLPLGNPGKTHQKQRASSPMPIPINVIHLTPNGVFVLLLNGDGVIPRNGPFS